MMLSLYLEFHEKFVSFETPFLPMTLLQILTYATTVQLLCQVQQFIAIHSLELGLDQNEASIEFN